LHDNNNNINNNNINIIKRKKKKRRVSPLGKDLGPLKYLSFHENYRPPYHGTFSRANYGTHRASGKNILRRFEVFDYNVDSDEEWEEQDEEEEGESLSGDEEEDAEEQIDEDEDPFVVPDGYLSDDERLDEALKDDVVATTNTALRNHTTRASASSTLQKLVVIAPMYTLASLNTEGSGPDNTSSLDLIRAFEGQILEVDIPIVVEEPKKVKKAGPSVSSLSESLPSDLESKDNKEDSLASAGPSNNAAVLSEELMVQLIKV